jgi:hypothetical protein
MAASLIQCHRDPDLGFHGILGDAEKALDTEVLLDPLEEQFDSPARAYNSQLVKGANVI